MGGMGRGVRAPGLRAVALGPALLHRGLRGRSEALNLLAARDLPGLGALAERNALRMHADALAADPPLLYWQPATVASLLALIELRASGVAAWATIDAGPHLVAISAASDAGAVEKRLRSVPGVTDVLVCAPAGGARVLT